MASNVHKQPTTMIICNSMWLAMLLLLLELMVQTTMAPMEQPVARNVFLNVKADGPNHHVHRIHSYKQHLHQQAMRLWQPPQCGKPMANPCKPATRITCGKQATKITATKITATKIIATKITATKIIATKITATNSTATKNTAAKITARQITVFLS
jgi:hypothetical protein